MTNKQVLDIFGTCRELVELEERKLATMKKLIFAYAGEHLKQNEVKQTIDDWQYTRAALDMLMGKKQFTPNVGGFYGRRGWPTHIRIHDLKPVRVKRDVTEASWFNVRFLRGSKVEETVHREALKQRYLPLAEEWKEME